MLSRFLKCKKYFLLIFINLATLNSFNDDDLEVTDYYPMTCYEVVKDNTWIFYKNNQVIKKEEYELGAFIK